MKFETIASHGFIDLKKQNHAISTPICANTAYSFDSVQYAIDLFDLKQEGDIYTRLTNPTNDIVEKRIAALEGGVGALLTSSGMSAILVAILNIAGAGDEIVSTNKIYGGTYNLFLKTFKQTGINVRFVNSESIDDWEKLINKKTKCLYTETIGNPAINIADIEALAKLAHKHGIPLIVDNTVATPYLCRPFEFGADIIVHSTTKYLSGHGNAMGGAIVDSGKFDWGQNNKFEGLTTPDESYHGITYNKEFGAAGFIAKCRVHLVRDLGCCQSPFNSYLTLMGLETLHVRMERHCKNTFLLAQHLEKHPDVNWVNYPMLKSSLYYDLAQKYLPNGASSLIAFGVNGNGTKFIEALKLFIHATNLGDVRSIITYPAGTTHRQMSDEELIEAGISKDFMRASIGIENIEDIIEDIDNAIKVAKG